LKLAHFGPVPPIASPLARWSGALLTELACHAEVGAFVNGYVPGDAVHECARVHDFAAVHWRNEVFAYDLAIYELADDPAADYVHDALSNWPGIVVLHDDDPASLFRRVPRLRRAVFEQSLAVAVRSPGLRDRLRATEPWTKLFVLDRREPAFEAVAAELVEICEAALVGRSGWIEDLLETACAELPSFVPGDSRAPWRSEIDELSALEGPARGRSARDRTNRRR
jgi:hypothetical protein